ncbi:tetratricopeptide repeat protein [Pseudemcibacter aquimaris]|uniref:tetratricopeptide repeat protein n=1 Tax=Pseudemcibacter aquimaris TaxID=2857064 RepID=UPI002012A267|nr:tetratricopeptide repeat protein [Pseudemcibacter aquimaris]MCC3859810.1 sel1 repeat family protein [Pseudemcibacter aquimaris]WDU60204.1 sel1 repeat family protein [Pseudemcibacter aquimaris]
MKKISKIIITSFAAFTMLAGSNAFASYEDAKTAYDERRFDEAFEGFTREAEAGHMMAQYYLGVMYATGRTMPRDDVTAYKWFMKAALQGHPVSQGNIGTMKLNARGTDFDVTGSYFWFILAEDGGFEKARKFMWRVTNYMAREDINSIRAKADEWIKENRGERPEE